jgi:hypothetical protein
MGPKSHQTGDAARCAGPPERPVRNSAARPASAATATNLALNGSHCMRHSYVMSRRWLRTRPVTKNSIDQAAKINALIHTE